MRPFGSRAMQVVAREKIFSTGAREFRPIYGLYEADLSRSRAPADGLGPSTIAPVLYFTSP